MGEVMISEYAQVSVLYNDAEQHGIRLHQVPRDLFDLIPGEAHEVLANTYPLLVKEMLLADAPGAHVRLTVYCAEAGSPHPNPLPMREGEETLLRESESIDLTGESSDG
jgi:hypothetical protein